MVRELSSHQAASTAAPAISAISEPTTRSAHGEKRRSGRRAVRVSDAAETSSTLIGLSAYDARKDLYNRSCLYNRSFRP